MRSDADLTIVPADARPGADAPEWWSEFADESALPPATPRSDGAQPLDVFADEPEIDERIALPSPAVGAIPDVSDTVDPPPASRARATITVLAVGGVAAAGLGFWLVAPRTLDTAERAASAAYLAPLAVSSAIPVPSRLQPLPPPPIARLAEVTIAPPSVPRRPPPVSSGRTPAITDVAGQLPPPSPTAGLAPPSSSAALAPPPAVSPRLPALPPAGTVDVSPTTPVPAASVRLAAPPPAPVATAPPDVTQIEGVLARYRQANGALDARAVAQVWPRANVDALSRAFAQLDSQAFDFEECVIDVNGVAAQARCTGRARYVPAIGARRAHVDARTWTFTLRLQERGWLIQSVDAR